MMAIADGTLAVVIDALDEGRIKGSEGGIVDFLRNVAELADDSESKSVRFVLLGRTHIADLAWLVLIEEGIDVRFLSIEPFDRAQREVYIERRIKAISPEVFVGLCSHPEPFADARNLLLEHLQNAIEGQHGGHDPTTAEAFLGYAPVLDAIAVRLSSDANFSAVGQELKRSLEVVNVAREHRPAALLQRIVEDILEREREQKLVHNIRPGLEVVAGQHDWSDWGKLFSIEEQCCRLVGHILGRPVETGLELPGELASEYEKQVALWLPTHPFLHDGSVAANAVFESYLYAKCLVDDNAQFRVPLEERLMKPGSKVSRLLADFYFLLASKQGVEHISPGHIGILYESLISSETALCHVGLNIDGDYREGVGSGEYDGEAEGEFVVSVGAAGSVKPYATFRTFFPSGSCLRFSRYLEEASLSVPCTLVLGTGGGEFEIGPAVAVRAAKVRIDADSLVIADRAVHSEENRERPITLEAQEYLGSLHARPTGRGQLRVSWPGAQEFPWTEFAWSPGLPAGTSDDVAEAYLRFRRIVMALQSHSRGSLARFREKIEHRRVLQGEVGRRLLDQLLADGVLVLKEKHYHWVPETATRLVGVTWHELRLGETTDLLRSYLEAFTAGNRDLFC